MISKGSEKEKEKAEETRRKKVELVISFLLQ
jgi:hypothetical protein